MALSGNRILITGGLGFVGRALARRLVDHNEVVIYDIAANDSPEREPWMDRDNVQVIPGDVLDADALQRAISGCAVALHLAAISRVDHMLKMLVRTMQVSVLGTYNLLEAAVKEKGIKRLIDFSTGEVFGSHAYKVQEADVTTLGAVGEARWTYAMSKLATEHLAHNYYKQYGLPALSIRPFNVYGPGSGGRGAVPTFIERALRDEPLEVHNDGSQIRAWCYVDDFVDAVMLCIEKEEAVGEAFSVANPRSVCTIYNLARDIVRLSGSQSQIVFVPWDFADVELAIPSIEKAQRRLGYHPNVDMDEGLLRTIDWTRSRLAS